jgi:spore coat protein CotH
MAFRFQKIFMWNYFLFMKFECELCVLSWDYRCGCGVDGKVQSFGVSSCCMEFMLWTDMQ